MSWTKSKRTVNGIELTNYKKNIQFSEEQREKTGQLHKSIEASIPELTGITANEIQGSKEKDINIEFSKDLTQQEEDSLDGLFSGFVPQETKSEKSKREMKDIDPDNLTSVPQMRAAIKHILRILSIEHKETP